MRTLVYNELMEEMASEIEALRAQLAQQQVPDRKETGEWEYARVDDFNSGWNACRAEAMALLEKAAWMELDTTKRSISIQDDIRAMLAAAPAPERCEYCDGTGDVHGLDGEWKGSCVCPAGSAPAPANPAGQWIPVTERLPHVAQEVIVSTEFEGICAGVLDSYGEWFAPCSEYKLTRVTHWMPLPAGPEVNCE